MDIITHTLPPHMERVVTEREELREKIGKLRELLTDQPRIDRLGIDAAELQRLRLQYNVMGSYEIILSQRLEAAR